MFRVGAPELILILAIVLLVFGVGKLPEIGAGFGKSIRNFKKAMNEDEAQGVAPGEEKQKIGSNTTQA